MKDLRNRTRTFALGCIDLCEKLPETNLGRHIQRQLIRSSTSVAANYRAANLGQTKAVFIAKLSTVIEESDESEFWLEMIKEKSLLNDRTVNVLINEAHELASIFIQSRKTAQNRPDRQ